MTKLVLGDSCKNGHVLTDSTVYYFKGKTPRMRCALCINDAVHKYYHDGDGRSVSLNRLKSKRMADIEAYRQAERESKRREYNRNPAKFAARGKLNRTRYAAAIRAYHMRPDNRIHSNISRAVRFAIGHRKHGRGWESILGYTLYDLMRRLETQFAEGMSWQNYGAWEIDHIKPKSRFDVLAGDHIVRECWALANLQPLWMSDNRRKHAHF